MNYKLGQIIEVLFYCGEWAKCKIIYIETCSGKTTWDVERIADGRTLWWRDKHMIRPLSALHALAEAAE